MGRRQLIKQTEVERWMGSQGTGNAELMGYGPNRDHYHT